MKNVLQNKYNKFHGGKVVVMQKHLKLRRFLDLMLGFGSNCCAASTTLLSIWHFFLPLMVPLAVALRVKLTV
jgi:hypothetical protein